MPSAGFALQVSIYEALVANAPLSALMGGPRVFDDVPRDAPFPYVTFGQSTVRDCSTGNDDDDGDEHLVTLHVWSRAGGRKETHEIMGALETALDGQALTLTGHRLVNLRHELSEARRDADGETTHGIVRYRAVTERQ